ncbi:MAG: hypothetical protein OEW85_05275 [Acidimicrobiia bacterium]|nr:hypothetical protein [Acidimicrobiia bacterium]
MDLVARLAATTDPAKAPRDAAEETRADHDLVGTIYRPLTERFDHEYAVAGAEARAAAGLAAAPVLPITPALAEAAAADFKARNPDVSDAYAIEEGRRELAAARDQVLRQRRQQHREAVDRLEETRQAADEHRRRAKKAAMASVT